MSRFNKITELVLLILLILAGPRAMVVALMPKILENFTIPWGLSNTIILAIFVWIYLLQENSQIQKRILITVLVIPSITIFKIYLDHGWAAVAFLMLGKIPGVGEIIQKVEFLATSVAFFLCLPTVIIDAAVVIIVGDITGKIPVTSLKEPFYQILQIMGRWLPWNRD